MNDANGDFDIALSFASEARALAEASYVNTGGNKVHRRRQWQGNTRQRWAHESHRRVATDHEFFREIVS